jgi:hypothetical protein
MRARTLCSALMITTLSLSGAATAVADDDDDDRRGGKKDRRSAESFQGTCQFEGTVRQHPPLTNLPAPGRAFAVASGTCTGTLTDSRRRSRSLNAERVFYAAQASSENMSCGGGTAEGSGFMLFRRGERIDFGFSEVRGPGTGVINLTGRRGGSAQGNASVSPDEDPAQIVLKCSGEGLSEVDIDINLASTPTISG